MKLPLIPALALLLLTALPTHARLGETKAECEARYGKSVRDLGDRQFLYHKSGLGVAITYWRDKADTIAFYKLDGHDSNDNKPLSETELDALLTANSNGSKWKENPAFLLDTISWSRADLRATALYDRTEKTLIISDQVAAKQIEEEEAKKINEVLDDLPHLRAPKAEFEKHLGKPLTKIRPAGGLTYQRAGLTIIVYFWDEKAGRISIIREGPPDPFSDSKDPIREPLPDYLVQAALNATRDNSKWQKQDQSEDEGSILWHRADEKAYAYFHADQTFLNIVDEEFAAYEREQENKQLAEKLKDLGGFGETKDAFEKRYGEPHILEDGRFAYQKNGIGVFVTYWKERAAQLVFFKFDPENPEVENEDREEISDPELEALLKGNGNRLKWTKSDDSTEDRVTWARADAQAVAVYKSEEKTLTIYDRDYIAHLQKKLKDGDAKKLDGF